jgi:hypothetical protein
MESGSQLARYFGARKRLVDDGWRLIETGGPSPALAARHDGAMTIEIDVPAQSETVTVTLTDPGQGLPMYFYLTPGEGLLDLLGSLSALRGVITPHNLPRVAARLLRIKAPTRMARGTSPPRSR